MLSSLSSAASTLVDIIDAGDTAASASSGTAFNGGSSPVFSADEPCQQFYYRSPEGSSNASSVLNDA